MPSFKWERKSYYANISRRVTFYLLSSGGWAKITLKLPTLLRSRYMCQFNPTPPLQQQFALRITNSIHQRLPGLRCVSPRCAAVDVKRVWRGKLKPNSRQWSNNARREKSRNRYTRHFRPFVGTLYSCAPEKGLLPPP